VALPGRRRSVAFRRSRRIFSTRREFFACPEVPSATGLRALRLSGSLDTRKRIVPVKASGELDVAGLDRRAGSGGFVRSARRPGGESGVLVTADGPVERPEGRPVRFRNAGFPGAAGPEGEVQLFPADVSSSHPGTRKAVGGALEPRFCRTSPGMSRGRRPAPGFPPAVPWKAFGVPSRLPGREMLIRRRGKTDRSKGACRFAPRASNGFLQGGRAGAAVPDVARSGRVHFRAAGRQGRFLPPAGGKAAIAEGRRGSTPGDAPSACFTLPPRESRRLRRRRTDRVGKGRGSGISAPYPAAGKRPLRDRARDSCAPSLPVSLKIDACRPSAPRLGRRPTQRSRPPRGTWTFPSTRSRTASE